MPVLLGRLLGLACKSRSDKGEQEGRGKNKSITSRNFLVIGKQNRRGGREQGYTDLHFLQIRGRHRTNTLSSFVVVC